MRVLLSTCPAVGHFFPLVPLARALAGAGHQVRFAVAPELIPRAQAAGFAACPTGWDFAHWWVELRRRMDPGQQPGAGLPPGGILEWFVPHLFAAIGAPAALPGLMAMIDDWQPHLVVHDSFELAAPLAAAAAGIPSVHHTLGPLPPLGCFASAADVMAERWQQFGLLPQPYAGLFRGLSLTIAPPTLNPPLDGAPPALFQALRPVGYDAAPEASPPDWLARFATERPVVYGTLGTLLNADLSIFRALLDALSDEPLNVILTVGRDNDPAVLGALPSNARVEQYVAQSFILPRCAAVVCHAGSGTTLAALSHGLPLVVIPQGADNFVNAERCVSAGAAQCLLPGGVNADSIQRAIHAVLTERSYRTSAREIQAEIAAMPSPQEVVGQLLHLAANATRNN
jgi:UDP:flavonoid glycosyltransferase YjiC (YdhE family)